jgi:hypothetical protein
VRVTHPGRGRSIKATEHGCRQNSFA